MSQPIKVEKTVTIEKSAEDLYWGDPKNKMFHLITTNYLLCRQINNKGGTFYYW